MNAFAEIIANLNALEWPGAFAAAAITWAIVWGVTRP
jgi:hypothetical protein